MRIVSVGEGTGRRCLCEEVERMNGLIRLGESGRASFTLHVCELKLDYYYISTLTENLINYTRQFIFKVKRFSERIHTTCLLDLAS